MATIRLNQNQMTSAQKTKYKSVINSLISSGAYGKLVRIHGQMGHHMHSSDMNGGFDQAGEQRFLPWHRDFLLQLESLIQNAEPTLFVPYWDWTVDRSIPAWLKSFKPAVKMPSGSSIKVQRFTGASRRLLPLPQEAAALNNFSTYTDFTAQLEDYHNDVHSWVGGQSSSGQLGTMSNIMISPADPIFWMHHAQCDRLWSIWQSNHNGKPTLTGTKKTLDPWTETSDSVNSIASLHYSYA